MFPYYTDGQSDGRMGEQKPTEEELQVMTMEGEGNPSLSEKPETLEEYLKRRITGGIQ